MSLFDFRPAYTSMAFWPPDGKPLAGAGGARVEP